jgi:hypothetical protein
MAGSGLGAAREAILQEYLSNWLKQHAPKQPIEVGGKSLISGLCHFCTQSHLSQKSDSEGQIMYRYFRIAHSELTEHIEWLDQSSKKLEK